MAFANHTNTDVRHAFLCGQPPMPLLLGSFNEADYGSLFEYAVRPDEGLDFAPDCPHIIYFTALRPGIDQGYRFAKVLKTVAYVCVDEDEDGQPIYEKWHLKRHHNYDTTWVHAPA